MERIDAFIESLNEWEEVCKESKLEIEPYIFNLAYQLGLKNSITIKEANELKTELYCLVTEYGIKEKFLVNSLIHEMKNYLENAIRDHGENILLNESTVSSFIEKHGEAPEAILNATERLKSKYYRDNLELYLGTWDLIIQKKFSYGNTKLWDYNEHAKMYRKTTEQFGHLSEEELNTPMKDLMNKK
jgi:hypothetical protein